MEISNFKIQELELEINHDELGSDIQTTYFQLNMSNYWISNLHTSYRYLQSSNHLYSHTVSIS